MKRQEAVAAANAIRSAMKGFGTDEGALVAHLAGRTNAQMAAIVDAYTTEIKRDLIKDIKDETSSDFEAALVALCTDTAAYDASVLSKAMKGIGTNEAALTEIFCTRSSEELKRIAVRYTQDYKSNLYQDMGDETSGKLEKLYKTCLGERAAGDAKLVETHVQQLYNAGEGKIGTDEAKFVSLIAGFARPHVMKVAELYERKFGKSLAGAIKSEFSGELENALVTLVTPLGEYFAEKLHSAMAGAGTDEAALIRILIINRERCLREMVANYPRMYGKSLKAAVESEVSGNFRRVLVSVITNFD
jgi:annexin A7/11